jgi:hypothetical protein
MSKVVPFADLAACDIAVDAVYESSPDGQLSGEPVSKLLPGSGNMGGFRASGRGAQKNWVVLFTTGEDRDWPDTLDVQTGKFVYFGDNKKPGHELHDTSSGGNQILRTEFGRLHDAGNPRAQVPPFFVFKKHPTKTGARSVQFKGLAVPGFPGLSATEDLVAVWKATDGQRFQNYRATFTVLDAGVISRAWINDLANGNANTPNAPAAWQAWVNTGRYRALTAEPTTVIRSADEQTPDTPIKKDILEVVWEHFRATPIAFEAFAARVYQLTDSRVLIDEVTRRTIDGGRDAIGRYQLGLNGDPVYAEFALEAKCYQPPLNGQAPNTVGVKEVSRLISRIRHRQFGVLVTTSLIARQAYEEVREDRHPIVFISGRDIAEILIANGYNTVERAKRLLQEEFKV